MRLWLSYRVLRPRETQMCSDFLKHLFWMGSSTVLNTRCDPHVKAGTVWWNLAYSMLNPSFITLNNCDLCNAQISV